jgi:2-phosphosulfolactate phosphatase
VTPAVHSQGQWEVSCDFGLRGLEAVGAGADVVVIVDVLSFSTAVSVAADRNARVYPFEWKDQRAEGYAARRGAELAGSRGSGARFTLSPWSFAAAREGDAVVLPSPNGATLTMRSPAGRTYAGCLRNAQAVAARAMASAGRIAVIAAGERWGDQSLRPCLEDWVGAGAVISLLPRTRSPEADLAVAAFESAVTRGLGRTLAECASGVELSEAGYAGDIVCAGELNGSPWAPLLQGRDGEDGEAGWGRYFARG